MKKTGKLSTIITVSLLFAFAAPVSAQELPGSYDPRPDMASDIREQYWGTCWVMGGVSSLESYLVKTGLADPDIDLSEEDVLWWTNGNYSDQDPDIFYNYHPMYRHIQHHVPQNNMDYHV